MKTRILQLALVFLSISSCANVNKMMEKGNYDGAISKLVKSLAGKKNKDQEKVIALEYAFKKAQQRDLRTIAAYQQDLKSADWENIYAVYYKIHNRQISIEPLLPLVSEEGYQATFDFVDTEVRLRQAKNETVEYYYQSAVEKLEKSRKNKEKSLARSAYDDLIKIDQLSAKYKDCDQLRKIAIERGAEHFLVKMVNQSQTIMPQKFEEDLLDFSIQDINKLFKVYHTYYSSEIDYDFIIRMNIRNIQFSPEREKSRVYEDIFEETIEKEQNHKSERDTISKEKTEKLTVRHTATIEEVLQQKTVALTGDVEWFNVSNNEVYYSRPVEVEAVYENIYGRLIKGDRKYLNDDTKQKLSRNPRPFPTHEEMLHDAGIQLKKKMKGIIFDKES
ncbi:MAG: hypothetical protein IPK61_15120 [Saprospiraceae bacterium]|nr:hypothetical protein [Saprospiraceae bacterium]